MVTKHEHWEPYTPKELQELFPHATEEAAAEVAESKLTVKQIHRLMFMRWLVETQRVHD